MVKYLGAGMYYFESRPNPNWRDEIKECERRLKDGGISNTKKAIHRAGKPVL